MKVFNENDLLEGPRDIRAPNNSFISLRAVIADDGMGYTITRTTVLKGGPWRWHYKNHLETCYVLSGYAQLRDLSTNKVYSLKPGDFYVLDKNEPHEFSARTDEVELLCVFNPPLTGDEMHNEEGIYE